MYLDVGGNGGTSTSGDATGGDGFFGNGGDATSGNSGPADGGSVENEGGSIINVDSNRGGNGGTSTSGDATGGDSDFFFKRNSFNSFHPFGGNGGNAQSGNSGSVDGGSVENIGNGEGVIINDGSSK